MRQERGDVRGPVRQCGELSRGAVSAGHRPADALSLIAPTRAARRIVERARGAIGARFRLHGRDPAEGLDCVGLAGWALEIEALPTGYALRGHTAEEAARLIGAAGLCAAQDVRPGDLALFAAGPGQWHLAVAAPGGWVHADAGLRRVVERPGIAPWPLVAVWRREN